MIKKVSIPQGTRDFNAATIHKRNFILNTIRGVFELYGFEPLETPAMENLETLMGKYGEEGDKLIFKVLNNGLNNEKNIKKTKAGFDMLLEGKSSPDITERALKYDLTIPFARYVAMNHTKLSLPYRRYQVQNVWRGDKPQRGRYREFTQCDADVVGSYSLLNDTELALIYHDALTKLGLHDYELRINSRKLLSALALLCNAPDKLTAITTAIDKLDKMSIEKVKAELGERGLTDKQIEQVVQYVNIAGSNEEKISRATTLFGDIPEAGSGLDELSFILERTKEANITVDFSLARGLNYYTGIIYEARAPATVNIGSIGGGGRYDDLTGLFGVLGIPGVGISFGIDRIYDVLDELKLFPEDILSGPKVLFFNMGEEESTFSFTVMQQLRKEKIACELYLEKAKMSKQFSYAESKKIPYAIIIGSKEMEQGYCQIKDLVSGKQEIIFIDKLKEFFNK